MIIGLVGTFAAGKDTAAEYLVKKYGFKHVSTGNIVRKLVRTNDWGDLGRENLQRVGNKLRREHGEGYLVEVALQEAPPLVVSGMRNPMEVQTLKEHGEVVISIDAPINQRWERAKARQRIDDALTVEEFVQQQKVEESPDPKAQNITSVIAMSDYSISNEGTLSQLEQQLDEILTRLSRDSRDSQS